MIYLIFREIKMEISTRWILYGGLALLFSLFVYSISVSGQTLSSSYTLFLSIAGGSIWLIMTGLFVNRKYHNYVIYLILTVIIMIVVIVLIFNQIISPEYIGNKIYSYIIAGIFILTTIYETYRIIRWMGQYQSTIKSFEKDLEIDPKDITLLNNKGAAFAERKFNQEALECFEKILEIDPKDAAAWHNKGVILDDLRKHQEALKYYDKALTLDPKLARAKQAGKIILES
jgi:tetratricopeptide (TPR) repeat protein